MTETGNGKGIVGGVIGAFKLRLDFLALLVLNAVFIGVFYLSQNNRNERQSEERIALLERCFPFREEKR
jgi:uncharacterized membrane protein